MKVYELLDRPEKWTKKALARDSQGIGCDPHSKRAVSFCLAGAMMVCRGETAYLTEINVVNQWAAQDGYGDIADWNNAPERTYDEVIALAKELDI